MSSRTHITFNTNISVHFRVVIDTHSTKKILSVKSKICRFWKQSREPPKRQFFNCLFLDFQIYGWASDFGDVAVDFHCGTRGHWHSMDLLTRWSRILCKSAENGEQFISIYRNSIASSSVLQRKSTSNSALLHICWFPAKFFICHKFGKPATPRIYIEIVRGWTSKSDTCVQLNEYGSVLYFCMCIGGSG